MRLYAVTISVLEDTERACVCERLHVCIWCVRELVGLSWGGNTHHVGVVWWGAVGGGGVRGSAAISEELIPQPVTGLSAAVIHTHADTHTHTHTHTNTGAIESNVQSRRHRRGVPNTHTHTQTHCVAHIQGKRELRGECDHTGCGSFMTNVL